MKNKVLMLIISVALLNGCVKDHEKQPQNLVDRLSADNDVRLYWAMFAQFYNETAYELEANPAARNALAIQTRSNERLQSGKFTPLQSLAKKIQARYHLTENDGEVMRQAMDKILADTINTVRYVPRPAKNPAARELTDPEPELFVPDGRYTSFRTAQVYPLDENGNTTTVSCRDWFLTVRENGIIVSEIFSHTTCPADGVRERPVDIVYEGLPPDKGAMCKEKLQFEEMKCWRSVVKEYAAMGLTLVVTAGVAIEVVAMTAFWSLMTYLMCHEDAHTSYKLCLKY